MSGLGSSLSFCAVRVVRWGPILEAGIEAGSWRAAPEEFRLRSLELRAEMAEVEEELAPAGLEDEDDEVGNEGVRRGGLAVETCGLNDTFRVGLLLLEEMFRGALLLLELLEVGSRGDASDAPLVAIVADFGRLFKVLGSKWWRTRMWWELFLGVTLQQLWCSCG